jgi:hypothetical protein
MKGRQRAGIYKEWFLTLFLSHKVKIILFIMCTSICVLGCSCGSQTNILKNAEPADYEKMPAPTHVDAEYNRFTRLRVTFNADVIIPDASSYPVVEVSKRIFAYDESLFLITLCSGKTNELYSDWTLTKDDWSKKLTEVEKFKNTFKITEEWLDFLKSSVENAPIIVQNPIFDGSKLQKGELSRIYLKVSDNIISKYGFELNENIFFYYRDMFLEVLPNSRFSDDQFDEKYETLEHFLWLKPGNPEISKSDAYAIANNFVQQADIDLSASLAEPCSIITNQVNKKNGWLFTFTRSISGLSAHFADGWFYSNPQALPQFFFTMETGGFIDCR